MNLAEKLYKHMVLKGLNQQRLANLSQVSDSEVSRILAGKSYPGIKHAFRLAKSVGVSLDYLADDSLDHDPHQESGPTSPDEREMLELAREMGFRRAVRILETARFLGYDVAIRRLVGAEAKPVIEIVDSGRTPQTAQPIARANTG
jgi:transcriptional regulator with XRE-family HTH domain